MRDEYEELCARIRSKITIAKVTPMKKDAEILNLSSPQITQSDIDREIEKLRRAKEGKS